MATSVQGTTELGVSRALEVSDATAEKESAVHLEDGAVHQQLRSDAELEKRVVRKMDKHFVPLLMGLYLMSYLDRSNIGNAKIAGMKTDLDLSSGQYQWLLTIFYISYVIFEWFALMWKIVPPHMWAAFVVFGFGTIAILQSTATSWSGMMALRFFLGMFEAAYGPGIPYLLSFFYLRHELGVRCGMFVSAAPLSTCFAGALAYGITSGKPKIANWRLLFIVEGLPSIGMAIVAWFYLPDSPEKAKFLTEDEKVIARARGVRQVGAEEPRVGHIRWRDVLSAMGDIKNWLTALMYFSSNLAAASLPVFLPTILLEMGFTSINAQGLSAPPYFLSFILTLASTYVADRTQQRGLTLIVFSLFCATGYIILGATSRTAPRYFGVFLAAGGIFPCIANILPWVLNNQGSDTKRGVGIAIMNIIGQCGPLLGTTLYPAGDAPYYRRGMWTCAGFMLFNGFLALSLRTLLIWENKKLDKKYGVRVERTMGGATIVGTEEDPKAEVETALENDGPNFRYVL